MSHPRVLLVAVHGIRTSQADPSWPDELDAWMFERDEGVKVLKKEYYAGAFPRFNTFFRDPKIARGLASEIAAFMVLDNPPDVWLVCHSNGVVIGLKTIAMLLRDGFDVNGAILVGGAWPSDVRKNKVLSMTTEKFWRGSLLQAVAFSNQGDDTVPHAASPGDSLMREIKLWLWRRLAWPYGGMGHDGLMLKGKPYSDSKITNLTFPKSYAHSGYWSEEHRVNTFEKVHGIITD